MSTRKCEAGECVLRDGATMTYEHTLDVDDGPMLAHKDGISSCTGHCPILRIS